MNIDDLVAQARASSGRYWRYRPYGKDIEILERVETPVFKTSLAMVLWFDTCAPNGVPVWSSKP